MKDVGTRNKKAFKSKVNRPLAIDEVNVIEKVWLGSQVNKFEQVYVWSHENPL